MYRLAICYLLCLLGWAVFLSFLGYLPYSPLGIIFLAVLLTAVSLVLNKFFGFVLKMKPRKESAYITALILTCIITPPSAITIQGLVWYFTAAAAATASKYILAISKKHIFNPAAFGAAFTALFLGGGASWWIGTPLTLPAVIIGGFLIVKRLGRFDLLLSFFAVFLASGFIQNGLPALRQVLVYSPILFFAFIMLPEPLTSPAKKGPKIIYGALVGILSGLIPLEWALLSGNMFAYIFSSRAFKV